MMCRVYVRLHVKYHDSTQSDIDNVQMRTQLFSILIGFVSFISKPFIKCVRRSLGIVAWHFKTKI